MYDRKEEGKKDRRKKLNGLSGHPMKHRCTPEVYTGRTVKLLYAQTAPLSESKAGLNLKDLTNCQEALFYNWP